ncbi:TonB-dependent receptor [Aliifodinibius sp. S!AR15-10]|nr:TonB-dependent receptor [Aliifodinibius sp. S!AR15-10]
MLFASGAIAQTGSISGTITDSNTSDVLPGANVFIQDIEKGTAASGDGTYIIEDVPYGTYELQFSFVGYQSQTKQVVVDSDEITVNAQLSPSEAALEEVFVTAYGIEQSQNELPYSAQKVDGDIVAQNRNDNFLTSLSGRVAGLKVSKSNGMGGSTNMVMRGYKSISGNNQVLFVVDGVPYANREFNTEDVEEGDAGYDYGNTAVDINPDNIASINVLKGPAAAALYGSRASNGAIVIETKKAEIGQQSVDVTFNSSVTASRIDQSTFPEYQMKYGQGYGPYYSGGSEPYFYQFDANGDGSDDLVAPYTADASFGPRFDADKMVYTWESFANSGPNSGQPQPWTAPENTPVDFFETGMTTQNSISVDGGFTGGYYALGYNQNNTSGIMPNSELDKHKLNFSAGYDISEDLHVSASVNYARTEGLGRPQTGYSTLLSQFRQWWATSVDIESQRDAYFRNGGSNTPWNVTSDLSGPFYWSNIYWSRHENYSTDQRDRYFGYTEARYDVNDWLSFTGRVAIDNYSQIIEERTNKPSATTDLPEYTQRKQNFTEFNYDLLANYDTQLSETIGVSGVVGMNIRRNHTQAITGTTNGGLVVPDQFSLDNSSNGILFPEETDEQLGVNGYFASLNLNYDDLVNIELTGRRDKSSSLPEDENVYYYPSASAGFIFSEIVSADWLTFGKIRASVASVGNTAPPASLTDRFNRNPSNFGRTPLYTLPNTKNNPDLKPERTKSWEVGLQMSLFQDRFSYDINYYDQNTLDQILATEVSRASGYQTKFVNAGNVENRGIELTVTGRPVVTQDFAWTVTANWNKNINEVKALAPGVDNYQLAAPQGDVTISAALGEPYGAIRGSDFIYQDGEPVVNSSGFYKSTASSNHIIGNMNPDWTGGISNRINYKNWSLNFLVDVRWGGDIFSLDQYYGQGTGLYPVTAAINDNGNNVRDPVSEGGGVVLDGVKEDGSPNDIHAPANTYAGAFGWINNPSANFVYDGSYVKLREVGLTYSIPQDLINRIGLLRSASVSVIGRNLLILHKNLPYADPEQGIAVGNVQGYQGAAHPTTRDVTLNLKLRF